MIFDKTWRFIALLLTVTFIFPQQLLAQVSTPLFILDPATGNLAGTVDDSEIGKIKRSLEERSTYLEYTKYMMLLNKEAVDSIPPSRSYSDYSIRPRGTSPLSREYSGIPVSTSGFSYGGGVSESINLITGGRAIQESLQLGSIGTGQAQIVMTPQQRNAQAQLRQAIQAFYNENREYPDRLDQLDLTKTLGTHNAGLANDFTYRKVSNYYELKLAPLPAQPIPIEDVEGLTIEHHPWQEMIGGADPEVADIYRLIPDDYFFIHFNDLKRYRELEETISEVNGPLSQVYGIGDSLSARDRIFARLGIVDIPELDAFIDEVAFVSYDFDGYPATDYALILKLKSSKLDNFVSTYIKAPEGRKGEVGDYYVVATSEPLFDHIEKTESGKVDSMASSLDLKYSLKVLDEERDGMAFISDAFVEKVTSPEYRINARRRNTVLNALETLQYASFAYRDITGSWPSSINQMMEENYLKPNSVYEPEKYSINNKGIVSHQDWGSIYNVTPIARVNIDTVLPAEKMMYDRFREGYQQFWREFIDPVAVSILVGDQIRLHTIILPLIDSSEYNWIKDVVGSENEVLDFVVNPDRIPAVQLTSHLDMNSLLYAVYRSAPYEFDKVYQECRREYYDAYRLNSYQSNTTLQESCSTKERDEEGAILAVKETIAEIINWEGASAELFSFMGDEVTLAASENATFLIEDLSEFDVYLGIEFSDPESGKEFVDHLFEWVFEDLFGGQTSSMGLFGIAPGKPIKNTYNGVEYFVLPTGFINLFYIYIDNRMYLTVSQNTINSLIEGREGVEWPDHMMRLRDYLDSTQDVSFLLDGKKLDKWINSYAKNQLLSYAASANLESMKTYLKEVNLFEDYVSGYSGSEFYHHVPNEWFGLEVQNREGKSYVKTTDGEIDLDNVERFSSYYGYYGRNTGTNPNAINFEDFIKNVDIDGIIEEWVGIDTFGAELDVTKEGLDIQVVFNNYAREKYDDRVPQRKWDIKRELSDQMIVVIVGILVLILMVGMTMTLRHLIRHREEGGSDEGGLSNSVVDKALTPDSSAPDNSVSDNNEEVR